MLEAALETPPPGVSRLTLPAEFVHMFKQTFLANEEDGGAAVEWMRDIAAGRSARGTTTGDDGATGTRGDEL